ncbi:MAG: AAA family ATPase [Planctomycetota bacterium]
MKSIPVIAFFNNKGGVGKTSLVYHLAWMYSDLGLRVVAADLDPQANLTAAFLEDERLEDLWPDGDHPRTVFGCVQPLLKGKGDIAEPYLEPVGSTALWRSEDEPLGLLVGDLMLSGFEDELSSQWPGCMDRKERAFRVISAFWRIMQKAAEIHHADLILMDLGPNLGAINRAALISANYVVIPLSSDLFSLQGLRNLGPTFRRWRQEWQERHGRNPAQDLPLPAGEMQPVGYIVQQHTVRLDRPTKAYDRWIARFPEEYRNAVLDEPGDTRMPVGQDPHCLALVKHYRSLIPLAQDARKPMFHLKPADGAIGAHLQAVQEAYGHFRQLAEKIAERTGISLPPR